MRRSDIVLIPGIGGHPRFHEGFVRAMERSHTVRTAPHADFFTEPQPDFAGHVAHWQDQLDGATTPAVVGISYGAHVALGLRRPPGTPLVLVSYWPLTAWQRRALRRLRRHPRAGAAAVGTVCFRWSEWTAADRDGLRRQRRELYDDERTAYRRLHARLTSLADAPPAPRPGEAALVYADREPALRRARRHYGGTLPDPAAVVHGTHNVSLGGTDELTEAVRRLIESGDRA